MFNKEMLRLERPEPSTTGREYIVPIWWLERHTADIVVKANSPDEAIEKVEDMIDSGQIVLDSDEAGDLYDWNIADDPHASN